MQAFNTGLKYTLTRTGGMLFHTRNRCPVDAGPYKARDSSRSAILEFTNTSCLSCFTSSPSHLAALSQNLLQSHLILRTNHFLEPIALRLFLRSLGSAPSGTSFGVALPRSSHAPGSLSTLRFLHQIANGGRLP